MRVFACVLKSGGDFTPDHVRILKSMVEHCLPSTEKFICMTDYPEIEGVDTLPLSLDLPGKYSMMEVFWLPGPIIVTGLDTVFIQNMDRAYDLVEAGGHLDFWLIKAFNPHRNFANGMMGWNGDWSRLITGYDVQTALKYSLEQRYTIEKLKRESANIRVWNDEFNIESYKRMAMNGRVDPYPEIDVVMFHGNPRPHQVNDTWVKKHWR